jgi:hypothetical protein
MAKSTIIKDFAGGRVSVEIALKQLKVLLAEFDKPEMLKWVNAEMQGYDDTDVLPEYRVVVGNLVGNFLNYYTKCTHISIPLKSDAPKELVEMCSQVRLYDSLSALRALTETDREFGRQINASLLPYVQQFSAISMTALLNATVEFSQTQVKNVFSRVENAVLDVLLLLEKEFGNLDDLDIDLTSKSNDEIQNIASNIMILLYNNNSIVIGNNNRMKDTSISSAR